MITKKELEILYRNYNRREFICPDPLEFLYHYNTPEDREIAALIASALAYGRVAMIRKNVQWVLDRMTPSPARFLTEVPEPDLRNTLAGFRHRFATGEKMADMLLGAQDMIRRHGTLHAAFRSAVKPEDATVLPALEAFCRHLTRFGAPGHLVPLPERGSACKRMHLFLRWMVRQDDVDPGGWTAVPASKLIIPLDVHMHRVCRYLGLTRRKQADRKTALEITRAFARLTPEDPVRYDFALTRFGIRNDMRIEDLFPTPLADDNG